MPQKSLDYLIHFNKNHSKSNGQFISGDGDGDGILNDNINQRKSLRLERKDEKWAKRNYDRLYKKAYKPIKKEMARYVNNELNKFYGHQLRQGKISRSFMNAYNHKLAELMNRNVGDMTAPSGRVINFVAKRGDLGVYMALADPGYDMTQVRSGVYESGKVAYKKSQIDMR